MTNILVVSQKQVFHQMIIERLRHHFYLICVMDHRIIAELKPDEKKNMEIVIVDAEEVRSLEKTKEVFCRHLNPAIEVIVISDTDQFLDTMQAMAFGAFAFLTEPFESIQLIKTIELCVRLQKMPKQLNALLSDYPPSLQELKQEQLKENIKRMKESRSEGVIATVQSFLKNNQSLNYYDQFLTSLYLSIPEPHKKANILVVEDDKIILENVENILKKDFNLYCAQSKKDLEKMQLPDYFDVIILDVYLPDTSAQECLEVLGKQFKSAKFLIMTAYQDAHVVKECFELGANAYFNKPFPSNQLVIMVMNLLQEKYFEKVETTIKEKTQQIENQFKEIIMHEKMLSLSLLLKKMPILKNLHLSEFGHIFSNELQPCLKSFLQNLNEKQKHISFREGVF